MNPLFHVGCPIQLENFPADHYFLEAFDCLKQNAELGNIGPYGYLYGIPFPFDLEYKRIGVNFSGGADSTILLCMLCELISKLQLDIEVIVTSVVRYYNTAEYSEKAKENIFNEIQKIYKGVKLLHVWGFLPPPFEFTPLANITLFNEDKDRMQQQLKNNANADTLFFLQYNDWVIRKYKLNTMYNGTTTNPINAEINKAPAFRNKKNLYNYRMNFEIHNLAPFALLEKSYTTALYNLLGVQNLFDMTHSCDETESGCGICFHCSERQYGKENAYLYLGDNHEF